MPDKLILVRYFMKRIYCLLSLCLSLMVVAQTVVSVDPETWKASELNAYIGQTITLDAPFYVCNNYYFGSGSYYISPRRVFSPTNQALPLSDEYSTVVSLNQSAQIRINGISDYHRCGEKLISPTVRVVSSSQVQLVGEAVFEGNTRADMAEAPSVDIKDNHTLLICGFNLEYYLVESLGTGYGPDDKTQSDRQHSKIMDALLHINADVYGLVEIEQGQSALRKIAQSLTDSTGIEYSFINDGGSVYGSYTKSGYVYRTDKVAPVGSLVNNNVGVSNRKKIQRFRELESDSIFSFSINHFKAKSGSATGKNADQGDGQGTYNYDRTKEAQSVVGYHQQYPNMLVMGDLNAYAKEDPITTFTNSGFIDLHRAFHADSSYSYVYRDQAGYLDHALADVTLNAHVTGMAVYHINSDEHDSFTYDGSRATANRFRSSDHDPVLVGLNLSRWIIPPTQDSYVSSVEVSTESDKTTYKAVPPTIYNAEGGYYRLFTLSGNLITESKITSDQYSVSMPQEAGMYVLMVYANGQMQTHKVLIY